MPMHPDASAVWNQTWDVQSPNWWPRQGYATLVLISKRADEDPDKDAERADEIAGLLLTDAEFIRTGMTWFNHQALRWYKGTGLTDLAVRRG